MTNNQDIPDRRIYLVKPRIKLINILKNLKEDEIVTDVLRPHVVMTEELPFEEYLEGYRKTVLELCKLGFLKENIHEYPLIPESLWSNIPSINDISVETFDMYWETVEAEYTNIPTTWK